MIIRNEHTHVSKNFLASEFYTKDPDFPHDGHYFDDRLIKTVQWLRDHFNVPVIITSTFRSHEYNLSIGGAKNSFHTRGLAVDFYFRQRNLEIIPEIEKDVKERGPICTALETIGIKGFLFYTNFIHLDCRKSFFTKRYL